MDYKEFVLPLALLAFLGPLPGAAQEKVETSRPEIEKIVRDYILQHPEVIAQAANLYQEQQKAAAKARAK
jgi:copper resistance ScsC-like protein